MISTTFTLSLINPFHSVFINKIYWFAIKIITKIFYCHITNSITQLINTTATTHNNTLIIRLVGLVRR